ncbi:uncharacterized protein LOC114068419 [Empidonax traillii]|uniref:uncharacterized protein LOC114068419 n=1 Tax=Empidonax traillii TaxID=164674 RepID=UPI000FFD9EA9|nr:uncharacterized protein LOC114068419 [Empidonax traillii]
MAERSPSIPWPAWVVQEDKEGKKGPGDAPAQQPEVEVVQPLQTDPVGELPEEKHTHGLFDRYTQMFSDFHKTTDHEDKTTMDLEGTATSNSCKAEDCAAIVGIIMGSGSSHLNKVPTVVRDIYQKLTKIRDVSHEDRLEKTLQEMAAAEPHDVVVTLLRCAPSCDRAAVTMWKAIVSSSRAAEKVLPELLCVLEDWPLHSTCTSDRDYSDIFSLAATRALWEIIHLPHHPEALIMYLPRFFVALLFQVFSSTAQMTAEVNTFWRRCQQEHCLPTNPIERECGWDTLLNTDNHQYAVGLLARVMLRVSQSLCYRIARYLFRLLRREEARWEVSAMAFLVELLPCLNIKEWGERILQLFPIYLLRDHRVMRLLLLRCLLVLCKRPSMANSILALTGSLTEVLKDKDAEVVGMTLSVLCEVLQDRDVPIASSIALQLAEALLPLFENDTSHVQLLSIRLFQVLMELVEEEGKESLEKNVRQSLFLLFCHLHDENQCVAQAFWETLLQANTFLQERKLKQLLEKTWRLDKCLVPKIVSDMYQWLTFIMDVSAENRLDKSLQEMSIAQSHDVVVTILRCAPSCDRAAVTMWKAIVSSSRAAEKVLPELLCVLEDWPLHSTCTSDRDYSDIFSLAATRALWEIIHLPHHPEALLMYFPCLFVALLFQVFSSTAQMTAEVNTFWRRCQQEHCLPTNPSRCSITALLCHLEYEDVVSEVERECGWDTLLNTDNHQYAVGLLARAMLRVSQSLCYRIARYLFRLLRREEARWEVSAVAFLVELLPCLNTKEWGERILQLFPIYLLRDHRVMCLLLLRCLLVLCKRPSMANSILALTGSLTEVLKNKDAEVVGKTLSVFCEVLQDRDVPIAGSIALQLAEALLPLFENDTSHVQLLSIRLFQVLMRLVEEEGKEPLEKNVCQSLLPLFYHMYDENQHVAQASWETLLQATKFLKKENLEELLETDEMWRFGECLLAEDRSRANEYLRQSVSYLHSPQKSVREAAIRLTARQGATNNFNTSISNFATQTLHLLRAVERHPFFRFRLLQNQLRMAWRRRPSLLDNGWPPVCYTGRPQCWRSLQS